MFFQSCVVILEKTQKVGETHIMAMLVAGISMRVYDCLLHIGSKFLLLRNIPELLSTSPHLCQSKTPFLCCFMAIHAEYCWNILKGPHPSISAEGLKFQPIASSKPWDISDIPSGYGSRMVKAFSPYSTVQVFKSKKKWRFLYVKL